MPDCRSLQTALALALILSACGVDGKDGANGTNATDPDAIYGCVNTASGIERLWRGGSWFLNNTLFRTNARPGSDPLIARVSSGIRCARDP